MSDHLPEDALRDVTDLLSVFEVWPVKIAGVTTWQPCCPVAGEDKFYRHVGELFLSAVIYFIAEQEHNDNLSRRPCLAA